MRFNSASGGKDGRDEVWPDLLRVCDCRRDNRVRSDKRICCWRAACLFRDERAAGEQQITKGAIEFNREVQLRELDEKHREAEFERQMRKLRLQRPTAPAAPDEGY